MGRWRLAAWAPWCAVFLVLVTTLSVLHVTAPHNPAQRDCSTCKALSAPALARPAGTLPVPVPRSSAIATVHSDRPLLAIIRYLRPLRAPPAFVTC